MQNNIGDARREYAEKHGKFTQEDAAKYFGVSLSTYKKWEQGHGRFKSCPADHVKQQVRRLKCLTFFSACAKRVQKMSRENKKAPYRRNGRAQILSRVFVTKKRGYCRECRSS